MGNKHQTIIRHQLHQTRASSIRIVTLSWGWKDNELLFCLLLLEPALLGILKLCLLALSGCSSRAMLSSVVKSSGSMPSCPRTEAGGYRTVRCTKLHTATHCSSVPQWMVILAIFSTVTSIGYLTHGAKRGRFACLVFGFRVSTSFQQRNYNWLAATVSSLVERSAAIFAARIDIGAFGQQRRYQLCCAAAACLVKCRPPILILADNNHALQLLLWKVC